MSKENAKNKSPSSFVFCDSRCNIVVERMQGVEPASNSQVHRGQAHQSAPSQFPETSLRSVEETRQIGEALQGQKLLQAFFRHG